MTVANRIRRQSFVDTWLGNCSTIMEYQLPLGIFNCKTFTYTYSRFSRFHGHLVIQASLHCTRPSSRRETTLSTLRNTRHSTFDIHRTGLVLRSMLSTEIRASLWEPHRNLIRNASTQSTGWILSDGSSQFFLVNTRWSHWFACNRCDRQVTSVIIVLAECDHRKCSSR